MPGEHPCEQIEGVCTFDARPCNGSGGIAGGAAEAGGKGGKLAAHPLTSIISSSSVALGNQTETIGFIGFFLNRVCAALLFGARRLDGNARQALPLGALLSVLGSRIGVVALLNHQAVGLRGQGQQGQRQQDADRGGQLRADH